MVVRFSGIPTLPNLFPVALPHFIARGEWAVELHHSGSALCNVDMAHRADATDRCLLGFWLKASEVNSWHLISSLA